MTIKSLNDFLSTETRKKIFLYYLFLNIAPSDIVDETNIPFSTVDRITQLLKAHEILVESEGKDMRERKYTVNFDSWIEQNLNFMGLGFLDPEDIRQIANLMKDKTFFVLSNLFTNTDFILEFFKEPLKLGDDIPLFILMHMNQIKDVPAQLPASILIYLEFSPSFKKLARDIDDDFLDDDISIINKGIKKYTFARDMSIDKDNLIEYEKKRADLILIMKRIFEKKILRMSVKSAEETKG